MTEHFRRRSVYVRTGELPPLQMNDRDKKVLEVVPRVQWDKGKAVLWLLAKEGKIQSEEIAPVYIGDDITDEDAFKALEGKGVTISVGGPKSSRAKYHLKDSEEVTAFLRRLLALRQGKARWRDQ